MKEEKKALLPSFLIIDASIVIDKRCNCEEKMLYSLIIALSKNDKKYCSATNRYFSNILGKSNRQIQRYLKKLELLKYIRFDYLNGKRIIYASIVEFVKIREEKTKSITLFDFDWIHEEE